MLRKLHSTVGWFSLVFFLAQGQYFLIVLGGLAELEDTQRLLYRTTHVYLLFAALLNIQAGLTFEPDAGLPRWSQFNQLLLLAAPPLLIYSFFFETLGSTGIDRPLGGFAVQLCFVWLVGQVLIRKLSARKRQDARSS